MSKKNFFLQAAPLFLVLFIDSMGLGLVFPILNALLFYSFHETFYHTRQIHLKLHRAIDIFIAAFKNEKVRELSIAHLSQFLSATPSSPH